jgi:tetratricopeptide (TPR) repeat protein
MVNNNINSLDDAQFINKNPSFASKFYYFENGTVLKINTLKFIELVKQESLQLFFPKEPKMFIGPSQHTYQQLGTVKKEGKDNNDAIDLDGGNDAPISMEITPTTPYNKDSEQGTKFHYHENGTLLTISIETFKKFLAKNPAEKNLLLFFPKKPQAGGKLQHKCQLPASNPSATQPPQPTSPVPSQTFSSIEQRNTRSNPVQQPSLPSFPSQPSQEAFSATERRNTPMLPSFKSMFSAQTYPFEQQNGRSVPLPQFLLPLRPPVAPPRIPSFPISQQGITYTTQPPQTRQDQLPQIPPYLPSYTFNLTEAPQLPGHVQEHNRPQPMLSRAPSIPLSSTLEQKEVEPSDYSWFEEFEEASGTIAQLAPSEKKTTTATTTTTTTLQKSNHDSISNDQPSSTEIEEEFAAKENSPAPLEKRDDHISKTNGKRKRKETRRTTAKHVKEPTSKRSRRPTTSHKKPATYFNRPASLKQIGESQSPMTEDYNRILEAMVDWNQQLISKYCTRFLKRDPQTTIELDLLFSLGKELKKVELLELSIQCLKKYIDIARKSELATDHLREATTICAFYHREKGEDEVALKHFKQIKGPQACYFAGEILHRMGNNQAAITYFLKVINYKTNNAYLARAHNDLGVVYEIENNLIEAKKHFKEAANGDAYGNLGRIYEKEGKIQRAIEYYAKGKDIADEDCAYNYGIMLINQKKDEPKEEQYSLDLLPCFELACTKFPELAAFQIAKIYLHNGKLKSALKYFRMTKDSGGSQKRLDAYIDNTTKRIATKNAKRKNSHA